MAKYTYIPTNKASTINVLDTSTRAHVKMTSLYLKERFGAPTIKYKATDEAESASEWIFTDKDNKPFTVYVIKGHANILARDIARDLEVQDFIFWVSNKK